MGYRQMQRQWRKSGLVNLILAMVPVVSLVSRVDGGGGVKGGAVGGEGGAATVKSKASGL